MCEKIEGRTTSVIDGVCRAWLRQSLFVWASMLSFTASSSDPPQHI